MDDKLIFFEDHGVEGEILVAGDEAGGLDAELVDVRVARERALPGVTVEGLVVEEELRLLGGGGELDR